MSTRGEVRTATAVAVGGALGATARWASGSILDGLDGRTPDAFPWHTLVVNVIGCLLIGVAVRRIDRATVAWSFAATGVLGGFTTMSAFAVEVNDLAENGRLALAVLYAALTFVVGLGALLLGERVPQAEVASHRS